MFAPNWSAKAEYQYYNFGDSRLPRRLVPFGSFKMTSIPEGRHQLSLQLRRSGRRALLIGIVFRNEKAGIAPAFFDSAPSDFDGVAAEDAPAIGAGKFRRAEQSVNHHSCPKSSNPARIPTLLTGTTILPARDILGRG
jgi:hypothetical protein